MIDDNIFQYENKIKSPTSRFLDTTPTFTTYYHIDNEQSTTDAGFIDVASIVGHRSPIRFNKIEKFPIYGLDQIVLQIQEDEAGLDSSYEGEAVILPSTIKPVYNDFFIIPVLKDSYVFRIIDIQYDNIMPDNFYKISFKLEYIDDDKIQEIEEQKVNDYVCVLENIGTETNCIIEKSSFVKIKEIEKMYHEIIEFYMSMFYDERHNVFLGELPLGKKLYDPLQAEFINRNKLFNEKNNLQTLILTDEYNDPKRKLKYNKSVYKYIELKDHKLLSRFKYTTRPGVTIHESSFYRWHDKKIEVLDIPNIIPDNASYIFSEEYKDTIFYNTEAQSEYGNLIRKFVRGEDLRLKDISLELDTELIYMNNSLEVFFFTPIIMYIIREIIKKELEK